MNLASPGLVASLTIAYRQLNEPWDSVGVSLITEMVRCRFDEEFDTLILDFIAEHPHHRFELAETLATDPRLDSALRAEAILHAWPPDNPTELAGTWADPLIGQRWQDVEDAILTHDDLGWTIHRGHINALAEAAYDAALAG